MVSLTELMMISFIVGFSGAATPGPLLVVVIRDTLSGSWRNGTSTILAHGFLEGLIIISIVAGLRVVKLTPLLANGIATIGGSILVGFGILTLKGIRDARLEVEPREKDPQTLLQSFTDGALATAGNGYWYVWWFSAGLAIVTRALPFGAFGMVFTGFAHWLSDLTYYSIVIILLSFGRGFFKPRTYRLLLAGCSAFMVGFGTLFIWIGVTGQMPVVL